MSHNIVLPAHEPCGNEALGQMLSPTKARCHEIRRFKRCSCKPDQKNPDRGQVSCEICHGIGYRITSRMPGCGAISKVCKHCGLRSIWNDKPCNVCTPKDQHAPNDISR